MLRGLYTAAAGMLATTVSTDTLANNLANVNTIGYKSNQVNFRSFPEMLINRVNKMGQQQVGSLMTGSKVHESFVNHTQGGMQTTGNTFDMAIEGDGFFTIKMPSGKMYYTRAGNFTINEQGYVTTLEGNRVQGDLGDIQVNLDEGPFKISEHGELSAKNRLIDRIKITRFADNHNLEKVSDNLYEPSSISQTLPQVAATDAPLGYKIHQGLLEQSNVNPITELVNNIQGMRLYEALQKNIHMHNETLGRAVNDVGRYK